MPRKKWLPDNVTDYTDRHGKVRYRYRKTGRKTHCFKSEPGTPEFMAEYRAACGEPLVPVVAYAAYTYDALIVDFYGSSRWVQSKASTQKTYSGIIEKFRAKNGHKDVRKVQTGNIEKLIVSKKDTPAAANNLRKALRRLHRHAVKLGWRTDNPVDATDGFKPGKGFHCWTEEELSAFNNRWPIGTKERLAKELLLATALRKSDVLTVGPKHRVGDRLALHHEKNDSDTSIPMGAALLAAMDAYETSGATYMQTQFGKQYTPGGFFNWFKRACVKAGIPHCSPHGLRKAMSRRLAESGATVMEGRAITGHKTDKEFMKYAESANRSLMADNALANLDKRFANKP